ncbi:MAG TPA: hypothetical protein VFP40_00115, partial [Terriglobales bacterium]|nr:hypothetical protein [Terriglobales bacterium]
MELFDVHAKGQMIFGFNTDVKHEDTVYHVQSEAHPSTQTLLTTIFVQGRCVGKKSASYADLFQLPDYSEEKMHAMLKEQHRLILEALRDGYIDHV